MNETDGGFLSGLAWQSLNHKQLYLDIVYVRPPMPIWLRAAEFQLLPENWLVLGERWIFYFKIALYSWLGAAVLLTGTRRWILAVFGFVVSAHCYPAMAWHSVDGILFGVLAVYGLKKGNASGWTLAGFSLFVAMLCKQSFYPLLSLFGLFLLLDPKNRVRSIAWFAGAFLACNALFVNYLYQSNALAGFLKMTSGAASGGQALQHGLLDYFRITPELALPSLVLLIPVARWFWKGKHQALALWSWSAWLLALGASFVAITWLRQDHTVPFAQSRAMFWVGIGFCGWLLVQSKKTEGSIWASLLLHRFPLLLLGISWCAAVSWGYNLPILFATPWIWAAMEVSRTLITGLKPVRFQGSYPFVLLFSLLLAFHMGYEFVYRDGRRSQMTEPMGTIFPALSGIYSDRQTAELYRDLQQLVQRYGANFKTLPAFPQSNFLTKTYPPLPLDWVVNRETNGDNALVISNLQEKRPVLFIQKSFQEKIASDPELEITREALQQGKLLEETPHFWVVQWTF